MALLRLCLCLYTVLFSCRVWSSKWVIQWNGYSIHHMLARSNTAANVIIIQLNFYYRQQMVNIGWELCYPVWQSATRISISKLRTLGQQASRGT